MKWILFVILALALVSAAFAQGADICTMADSGYGFGMHIMEHAMMGMLSGDMNPGVMHQGYSPCVP